MQSLDQILKTKLEERVKLIMEFVREHIMQSYRDQGHKSSGALEDTAKIEIAQLTNGVLGILFLNDYWEVLDTGIPAENIPFNPGSGAGSSQYIDGLIQHFKNRLRVDDETAKKYAFATAFKRYYNDEGSPMASSNRFSSTGKRTGFLSDTLKENQQLISESVSTVFGQAMSEVVEQMNGMTKNTITIQA